MTLSDAEHDLHDQPPAGSGASRWLADFEMSLGLVVACFVGFVGVGLGGLVFVVEEWVYGWSHISLGKRLALTAAWVLVTLFEMASIRWMGRNWRKVAHPQPVSLALAQKRRGLVWGALRSGWWLAHAVLIVGAVDWMEREYGLLDPSTAAVAFRYAVRFGLLFGGAYASTVLVLLGFGAIGASPRALRLLWRCRVPMDLLVTIVLMLWRDGK